MIELFFFFLNSFYSTNKKVAYSTFIPRIKLPPRRTKLPETSLTALQSSNKAKLEIEDECMPNSLFDYDAYDAQVFQLPQASSARYFSLICFQKYK